VDCTFKAVERAGFPFPGNGEGLVVVVAAGITGCHEKSPINVAGPARRLKLPVRISPGRFAVVQGQSHFRYLSTSLKKVLGSPLAFSACTSGEVDSKHAGVLALGGVFDAGRLSAVLLDPFADFVVVSGCRDL